MTTQQAEEVIKVRARSYTRAEIADCGDRHGAYGTVYYPPAVWGTSGGWGEGQKPPQPYSEADQIYHAAYIAGRIRWRERFGSWPTGCDAFDADGGAA